MTGHMLTAEYSLGENCPRSHVSRPSEHEEVGPRARELVGLITARGASRGVEGLDPH
jgi:hypothetical protein